MNKIIVNLLLICKLILAQGSFVNPGTVIPVSCENQINCEDNNKFAFKIAHDILSEDGKTVIFKNGQEVKCELECIKVERRGYPGKINILFLETKDVQGHVVKLSGNYSITGDSKRGLALGLTWGTLAVIFPINFFFLLIKGEPAEIPSGVIIENAKVVEKVTIMH